MTARPLTRLSPFNIVALALGLWSAGLLERLEYPTWAWRVQALARPGGDERLRLARSVFDRQRP